MERNGTGGAPSTQEAPPAQKAVSVNQRTAADGSYHFSGLRPGTYSISETHPAGYRDGKDSVGSLGGTVSKDLFSSIALAPGAAGTDYDFGELPAPVPHGPPPAAPPGTPNTPVISKFFFLASTIWGWH